MLASLFPKGIVNNVGFSITIPTTLSFWHPGCISLPEATSLVNDIKFDAFPFSLL